MGWIFERRSDQYGRIRKERIWTSIITGSKGLMPDNYKYIPSIIKKGIEIRYKGKDNQYRLVYIEISNTSIYVLHSFIKKTQKTSKKDIDIIKERAKSIKIFEKNKDLL